MRLKTKLSFALGFLFLVILTFCVLSIFYINKLSTNEDRILKNNFETLMFCGNMLKELDQLPQNPQAYKIFEDNLNKQENNITEQGEKEATANLRKNFNELKADPFDSSNYPQIRQSIQIINSLNENAILRKNNSAHKTAEDANFILTIIFAILTLIAFTLVVNFPSIISNPIQVLSEGIAAIADKNYNKRIYLDQDDEFGDLAASFNSMAEKLDEYENSNLAEIKFEKSRIETIINQMKDGIVGLDNKRNILFLNKVAEKLLGLKEIEIIGNYAPDIALKNDLMRTLLSEENNKKELKIYADNKESYFNKDILNVKNAENNSIIGKVIVLRNITPFHELNEAKTNFIATVSHELKTPISSIKMSAKLLTDERTGNLNAEQNELITSIREDADRLLKITGELLNMAQVETGNIQLKLQTTNPTLIVDEAILAVKFQAQQKNIDIKVRISDHLPIIHVDAEKTTWVLINFLTNAIKYSADSSVINVDVYTENDQTKFTVQDQGKGIAEKYVPKIFDRYFKVPGTNEQTGTGLGLAISKEFIEAQGGHIWVNSFIGGGSTFGFTFDNS
ncbi:MAG TPA: ATP-binding protein [Ferruginibacter sp.]|jgi:PAS domain S-box-containing protein|nr:ATP-binding protein [Ferruginibacter sp.]